VASLERTSALTSKQLCPLKESPSPAWAARKTWATVAAWLQLGTPTTISDVAGAVAVVAEIR
jgi:hypothetical protein